jgi:uncharacterized damage-inducible protein DinB
MVNLIDELERSFHGDAWHGNSTMSLLSTLEAEKVYMHPIANAHSIAELVLHITAWTEEVIERIHGANAKEPLRGDWPMPKEQSDAEWTLMVNDFKKANKKLIDTLKELNLSDWSTVVKDDRDLTVRNTITSYAQLVNGLIQHHAYHSGQIALLMKF